MKELLELGSKALRNAALNENAKEFILSNPVLFNTMKKAADRYIGGETLDETVIKVSEQNQLGFKCSIEFMGESTKTVAEAEDATAEFVKIVSQIKRLKLHSAVSLDLSHIGLAMSKELCLQNLHAIASAAAKEGIEVIISAEGVERTDDILDTYLTARQTHDNVGITLQAYLHRTKDDFKEVAKEKGRIRVVKGAFETPAGLSLPRGSELDKKYLELVGEMLSGGHRCSIATHDAAIQVEACKLIKKYQPQPGLYEFESLYGIQSESILSLKDQGHPAKVYFVYGKEWYLYLCNRIAEHPVNIFRALADIVGVE